MMQLTKSEKSFRPGATAWISCVCVLLATSAVALLGDRTANSNDAVQVTIRPAVATALATAALAADDKPAPGTGTFKGVVTFKGTPPARKVIVPKGDPKLKPEDREVCAADDLVSDEFLVNEKAGNGVANVVIYLKKAPEGYKAPPEPTEPAVFDQKGCKFIPHVMAVRCNQKILIKSGDPVSHNTNITALRNPPFNKVIPGNERDGVEWQYPKPEGLPIPVKCDLHPWMKAHHLPLDHPFVAVTDEEGKFEIKDLPPGKHMFTVWHEVPGYVNSLNSKLAVEIKADGVTEEKMSFTAAQFKVGN